MCSAPQANFSAVGLKKCPKFSILRLKNVENLCWIEYVERATGKNFPVAKKYFPKISIWKQNFYQNLLSNGCRPSKLSNFAILVHFFTLTFLVMSLFTRKMWPGESLTPKYIYFL